MSTRNQRAPVVEISPAGQVTPAPGAADGQGRRIRSWLAGLVANPKAVVGGLLIVGFVGLAIGAPQLAPYDPAAFVGQSHQAPSDAFLLGTTGSGQDVLSQLLYGARVSLGAGFLVGAATTVIGTIVGIVAGYRRGWVDDLLSLVTNVVLIVPGLPLLVVLTAFLPAGFWTIVLVLTATGWAWPARVLRAQTLSLREQEFVSSAVVSGERSVRIMFREILPNMLSLVAAAMFGGVIFAIGAQAGLEFIGLGNVTTISWGTMLYWAGNNSGLLLGAWWTFVPAGLCIALVAFALALLNYAIDEVTNPRLRAQRQTNRALRRFHYRLGASRATPVVPDARVAQYEP